jgi:hypothetical protein
MTECLLLAIQEWQRARPTPQGQAPRVAWDALGCAQTRAIGSVQHPGRLSGPPELALERLGFGAELEGVLRIARCCAPGLVARGRGLAILADDADRTATRMRRQSTGRPGTLSLPRFASSANFMVGVPMAALKPDPIS